MALGLFGPVGPALMLSVMIVAAVSVHLKNGLFAMSNGIELPLLYGAAAAALALTGPGQYSLDALLGLQSRVDARANAGPRSASASSAAWRTLRPPATQRRRRTRKVETLLIVGKWDLRYNEEDPCRSGP